MAEHNTASASNTEADTNQFSVVTRKRKFPGAHGRRVMISDIQPNMSFWKLTARLTIKSSISEWTLESGQQKRSFSIFLLDEQGNEIRCVFMDKFCNEFFNLLQINSIYDISQCMIFKANDKFNDVSSTYELRVTARSSFEINSSADIFKFQVSYNFIDLSEVLKLNNDSFCDCMGVILSIGELDDVYNKTTKKHYKKRDIEILDKSEAIVLLNIWSDEAINFDESNEGKIIALKRVKVDAYNEMKKLTTKASSIVDFIHISSRKNELQIWYDKFCNADTNNVSVKNSSTQNLNNDAQNVEQVAVNFEKDNLADKNVSSSNQIVDEKAKDDTVKCLKKKTDASEDLNNADEIVQESNLTTETDSTGQESNLMNENEADEPLQKKFVGSDRKTI